MPTPTMRRKAERFKAIKTLSFSMFHLFTSKSLPATRHPSLPAPAKRRRRPHPRVVRRRQPGGNRMPPSDRNGTWVALANRLPPFRSQRNKGRAHKPHLPFPMATEQRRVCKPPVPSIAPGCGHARNRLIRPQAHELIMHGLADGSAMEIVLRTDSPGGDQQRSALRPVGVNAEMDKFREHRQGSPWRGCFPPVSPVRKRAFRKWPAAVGGGKNSFRDVCRSYTVPL